MLKNFTKVRIINEKRGITVCNNNNNNYYCSVDGKIWKEMQQYVNNGFS